MEGLMGVQLEILTAPIKNIFNELHPHPRCWLLRTPM
jgi:hypothetical protein